MRKPIIRILALLVFLAACTQISIPATTTPTTILTATTTFPPAATSTPFPTKKPTLTPVATITLPSIQPVALDPLALNEMNAGTEMKRLAIFGTGEPYDMTWSPDGKVFAVATARGVWLYDGATLDETGFVDVNDPVSALAFSPDGTILALAANGNVSLWSVQSKKKIKDIESDLTFVYELAYGRGGQIAALGCVVWTDYGDYTMILWDGTSGQKIITEAKIGYPMAPVFSPDGRLLAFLGQGEVKLVEANTGNLIARRKSYVQSVVFSPDSSALLIINNEARNEIWDFVQDHIQPVRDLDDCILPLASGDEVLVCGTGSRSVVIDLVDGKMIRQLNIKPTDYRNALRPDGELLAMLDYVGKVSIIDTNDASQFKMISFTQFFSDNNNPVVTTGMAVLDGGTSHLFVSADGSGNIQLWDIEKQQIIRTLTVGASVYSLDFRPDRCTLASLNSDRTLNLWDLQSGLLLQIFPTQTAPIMGSIAFSPDGLNIAISGDSGGMSLFSLQDSQTLWLRNQYLFSGKRLIFTSTGHLLTLGYNNETFALTDNSTGNTVLPLPEFDYERNNFANIIEAVSLSSDERYFAFGTNEGTLYIWDLMEEKLVSSFVAYEPMGTIVYNLSFIRLAFSPQSHLLVSVGYGGTRLWNVKTGAELRRLNVCCYADFTPDGRYLVTAGAGVIRVWGIPSP